MCRTSLRGYICIEWQFWDQSEEIILDQQHQIPVITIHSFVAYQIRFGCIQIILTVFARNVETLWNFVSTHDWFYLQTNGIFRCQIHSLDNAGMLFWHRCSGSQNWSSWPKRPGRSLQHGCIHHEIHLRCYARSFARQTDPDAGFPVLGIEICLHRRGFQLDNQGQKIDHWRSWNQLESFSHQESIDAFGSKVMYNFICAI